MTVFNPDAFHPVDVSMIVGNGMSISRGVEPREQITFLLKPAAAPATWVEIACSRRCMASVQVSEGNTPVLALPSQTACRMTSLP